MTIIDAQSGSSFRCDVAVSGEVIIIKDIRNYKNNKILFSKFCLNTGEMERTKSLVKVRRLEHFDCTSLSLI